MALKKRRKSTFSPWRPQAALPGYTKNIPPSIFCEEVVYNTSFFNNRGE
jgi:hypothetical protein